MVQHHLVSGYRTQSTVQNVFARLSYSTTPVLRQLQSPKSSVLGNEPAPVALQTDPDSDHTTPKTDRPPSCNEDTKDSKDAGWILFAGPFIGFLLAFNLFAGIEGLLLPYDKRRVSELMKRVEVLEAALASERK